MNELAMTPARANGIPANVIVAASALAVAILVLAVLVVVPLGPLGGMMLMHVTTMSVLAPAVAVMLHRPSRVGRIWPVALGQLALLWAAHLPTSSAAMAAPGHSVAVNVVMFAVAVQFWRALMSQQGDFLAPILALVVTAKLACLLGALLVFAPRPLYVFGGDTQGALSDQQVAGLVMLAACPLSYVVVAVGFAARAIGDAGSPSAPDATRL
ncbi:MAG: cytochrome C oxidase assembly protein [Alphaproteobacteria bacterium]|nr:cytochrome C oxidase assembly protein [Alphaproteobacteria bacterium]